MPLPSELIDSVNAVLDFKSAPNAKMTLFQSGFNAVEDESAIVTGFAMLIDPKLAGELAILSKAMECSGMDMNSAMPRIYFNPFGMNGVSLCGIENMKTTGKTVAGSESDYQKLREEAEAEDRMISDIAEIQVTNTGIVIQIAGNEEGVCESEFSRDGFLAAVMEPHVETACRPAQKP